MLTPHTETANKGCCCAVLPWVNTMNTAASLCSLFTLLSAFAAGGCYMGPTGSTIKSVTISSVILGLTLAKVFSWLQLQGSKQQLQQLLAFSAVASKSTAVRQRLRLSEQSQFCYAGTIGPLSSGCNCALPAGKCALPLLVCNTVPYASSRTVFSDAKCGLFHLATVPLTVVSRHHWQDVEPLFAASGDKRAHLRVTDGRVTSQHLSTVPSASFLNNNKRLCKHVCCCW